MPDDCDTRWRHRCAPWPSFRRSVQLRPFLPDTRAAASSRRPSPNRACPTPEHRAKKRAAKGRAPASFRDLGSLAQDDLLLIGRCDLAVDGAEGGILVDRNVDRVDLQVTREVDAVVVHVVVIPIDNRAA